MTQEVADRIAADFGLPPGLVRAFCQAESSWRPEATRYEPGFQRRYLSFNQLSEEENKSRATSWGLMQIMGQTARELGFTGKYEDLLDPETGIFWGCVYIKKRALKYRDTLGWRGVIAAYNAGTPRVEDGRFLNQTYVNRVIAYWNEYDGVQHY